MKAKQQPIRLPGCKRGAKREKVISYFSVRGKNNDRFPTTTAHFRLFYFKKSGA
jgi:hypothetical protein